MNIEWIPVSVRLPNKNQSVLVMRHYRTSDGKNRFTILDAKRSPNTPKL